MIPYTDNTLSSIMIDKVMAVCHFGKLTKLRRGLDQEYRFYGKVGDVKFPILVFT